VKGGIEGRKTSFKTAWRCEADFFEWKYFIAWPGWEI